MIKTINTDKAPRAIGPYSQAKAVGSIIYTSGQIPCDAKSGDVVGNDIATQAEQVMKNLHEVLTEAGGSFESTIKTTCFLASMSDFQAFNAVYAKYFTGKPARSCIAVKTLPLNVLIEVEAIALIVT